jgi:hypothetical protein
VPSCDVTEFICFLLRLASTLDAGNRSRQAFSYS